MADPAQILTKSDWFARQPPGLRQLLIAKSRISDVAPGQWIYGTGDALNGLYGVLEGSVHLLTAMADGEPRLLDVVQSGQLFGQPARFGGGPRLVTAVAGTTSRLLFVPDHALGEIARSEPDVWRNFAALLYGQLSGALQLAATSIHLSPRRRVAGRLGLLAGPGGHRHSIAVTQSQLAEMTGLSRKTVNAHLLGLERAGVVQTGYGNIDVLDYARLKQWR